jgi:hypothetical protein
MRKFLLVPVIFALLATGPALAATYQQDAPAQNGAAATKVEVLPAELQMRMDYSGGPSGSPVYIGYAAAGRATSDSSWLVWKFTYSGSDPTVRQAAYGTWDDRATLSYS